MTHDDDELLSYAAVSELTQLSTATLRGYRHRGAMPEPDVELAADRPRWKRSTITSWLASRPGKGAPGRARARRSAPAE